MKNETGSVGLCFIILIACAAVYSVAYYSVNYDNDEDNYIEIFPEVEEIKPVNFLEPEDKCLFT